MRQKMINLCPRTYDLAKKMPNFSGWVRRKILELHDYVDVEGYVPVKRARKDAEDWAKEAVASFYGGEQE